MATGVACGSLAVAFYPTVRTRASSGLQDRGRMRCKSNRSRYLRLFSICGRGIGWKSSTKQSPNEGMMVNQPRRAINRRQAEK